MPYEVEAKILSVDKGLVAKKLDDLGANKILDTKFQVSWFRTKGNKEGDDKWFLRIRTDSSGKSEITWKAKSNFLGASRKHKEINFEVKDPEMVEDLFKELNLEKYAYQEKYRTSWTYQNWRFDLDRYPEMPAYLEIEGEDEAHIQEAIKLLGLEQNEHWNQGDGGERMLIQNKYGLDWYNMKFV